MLYLESGRELSVRVGMCVCVCACGYVKGRSGGE